MSLPESTPGILAKSTSAGALLNPFGHSLAAPFGLRGFGAADGLGAGAVSMARRIIASKAAVRVG